MEATNEHEDGNAGSSAIHPAHLLANVYWKTYLTLSLAHFWGCSSSGHFDVFWRAPCSVALVGCKWPNSTHCPCIAMALVQSLSVLKDSF